MIEFEDENKKQKEKSKGGKGKPISPSRKAAAKAKVRDEAGKILGKRQLQLTIDYNSDEQRYTLDSLSGDGNIKESEPFGGIIGLKNRIDKIIHRWRGELT